MVGDLPKGIVLLADVMPSFATKLVAPYFIHRVPYYIRVLAFIALSAVGMLLIALTPAEDSVPVKMIGVCFASLSSGGGELSFLGLTHYYGHASLAGWGSGTGAAGLVGAGLYVVLTEWWDFSVRDSLLFSAMLPAVMFVGFFIILPRGPLRDATGRKEYKAVPESDLDEDQDGHMRDSTVGLLNPESGTMSAAYSTLHQHEHPSLGTNLRRAKALMVPYMLPLFFVFFAEYTINQGVSPTLLYPLEESPFKEYRGFYPFYGFLYQLGVFISRSSTLFVRIHHLYAPSLLQVGNLALLLVQSLFFFIPSVYMIFIIVFWEGLLGGAVYVNTFAEILEKVPAEDREFSLSAASVSDSAGICLAGIIGIALEPRLCAYQVAQGRDWCRQIRAQHG